MERGETCPPALALSTRLGGPYAEAHQASHGFQHWNMVEPPGASSAVSQVGSCNQILHLSLCSRSHEKLSSAAPQTPSQAQKQVDEKHNNLSEDRTQPGMAAPL